MQRRDFISCAAAGSVCAMAPAAVAQTTDGKKRGKNGCKITVLKRTIHNDLYEKYTGRKGKPCEVFKEGQEFTVKSIYDPPEGFCVWAWADIREFIFGAWFGREDVAVTCCTDGMRPVIFKVERDA